MCHAPICDVHSPVRSKGYVRRVLQAARTALGGFDGKLVGNEVSDFTADGIEPHNLDPLWLGDRSGGGREVAKESNKSIGGLAPLRRRRKGETVRGCMWRERGNGLGRRFGRVVGNQKLRLRLIFGLELRIGDGDATSKVGPAIPGALFDLIETVPGIFNGP